MSITRYFDLYLNAGKTIPLVINANQYDEGESWVFTLYSSNGVQYTPSTGAIVGVKSDGHGILNEATVNESGQVVVTETQQMTAASGKNIYELLIDDESHGTANFIVLVEPSPQDGIVLSDSDLSYIENIISSSGGMSGDIKQALLQLASKVAYIDDDGQDYYNDLYDALYPPVVYTAISLNKSTLSFGTLNATQQLTATTTPSGGSVSWSSSDTSVATVSQTGVVTSVAYGSATITATCGELTATCSVSIVQATVTSISAVYTQSGDVYDTDSLDSLKTDLVVTATWSNSTTSTVASTDYTLSGTLTVGTSTITVTYEGQTTTFNVTVTQATVPSTYTTFDYITITDTQSTNITAKTFIAPITMKSEYTYETSLYYSGNRSQATAVMGTRNGSNDKDLALFITPSTNKLGYWYDGTDSSTAITTLVAQSVNTIKILPVGKSINYPNNAVIVLNDTEYSTGSTSTGKTWSSWFGFFCYATSASTGGNAYVANIRIGETTIKDANDNVIHKFIPAYDGTYYGMYDLIGRQFYYNETYNSSYTCGNWQ